jgi:hypothetical protein
LELVFSLNSKPCFFFIYIYIYIYIYIIYIYIYIYIYIIYKKTKIKNIKLSFQNAKTIFPSLCGLLHLVHAQSTVLLHSPCTHGHHSHAGVDLESTVLLHSPRTHHHSRAGLDLEDGFGGRFAEARAHDLQRRRAHDLQRLGHTICRGGHMVLHRRRAHGRRKWFDLFLLSQAQ